MSDENTTEEKHDRFGMTAADQTRLARLTDDEITAAARSDPDNPPLTDEELAGFRKPALAKRVRHKLRMGRETFSASYGIPLDVLSGWERREVEPTVAEVAYLQLIEREPEIAKLVPEPA